MDLDPEGIEILEAFEKGELQSIPNMAERLRLHQQYAAETLRQIKFSQQQKIEKATEG